MTDEHDSPRGAGCCGSAMTEMAQDGCPCRSMWRTHRLALLAVLALVLVTFLISQVGGILGIAAFVRTF